METKDYVLVFGVAATLFLGIWNLIQTHRSTRKTSFINTVTSQRIQWIEQLRQDVAAFCGCTHTWYTSNLEHKPQGVEMLTEVDRLRYLIRLRLNPNDTYDRKVAAILKRIPELTHSSRPAELLMALMIAAIVSSRVAEATEASTRASPRIALVIGCGSLGAE